MKKVLFGAGFKSNNKIMEIDEMAHYRNTIWAMPIFDKEDVEFYVALYKKAGYEITMADEDEDYYFEAVNESLNEDEDDSDNIDKLTEVVAKEIAEEKFQVFFKENWNIVTSSSKYFEILVAENNRIETKIDDNIHNIRLIDLEYLKLLKDDLLKLAMHQLGYINSCRIWKKH